MSDGQSIPNIYLRFIQNQIDRTANAYRRSVNGQYGINDWFRDVTEAGADAVGTMWGPIKDILDTQMRWEITAAPGATGVVKVFRYSTSDGDTLNTQPFQSAGKADIAFTVQIDNDRRNVVVSIASVGNPPVGTVYLGSIVNPAGGGSTVASVTLRIV